MSVLHVVKRNQVNEKEWNKIIQEEMNIHQASFNLITGPLMKVVYFEDNLTENASNILGDTSFSSRWSVMEDSIGRFTGGI